MTEHIARCQADFNIFNITSPSQIVTMDQFGMSFNIMVGRSLRKGFVNMYDKNKCLALKQTLSAKGNLDRVTHMPVVATDGTAYKPCVVYPGKNVHSRKCNGEY